MKKLIVFCISLSVLHAVANDSAQFVTARKYINGIYNVISAKQQYIKASATVFPANDLLHPFQKSDFIMARKGNCIFQTYNNLTSISDELRSLQIDTLEKTIVIAEPIKTPLLSLSPNVLNQVAKINILDIGKGLKSMELTFNPNSQYQKIEMLFDTTSFKLTKLNLWFVGQNDESQPENRKMEVNYLVIDDKVPNNIDVCSVDAILVIDKEKNIKIKNPAYKDYEIINFFSN